jgi:hypothetical protein
MPKGNPPLSENEVHLLREWISAGAKDDSPPVAASAPAISATNAPSAPGLGTDPAARQALNDLLFSGNNQQRLLAQRALRLALVPRPPEPPAVRQPVFNPIDQFIVAKWEQDNLAAAAQPPPVCGDAAFLRRAYLDVIGVIPRRRPGNSWRTPRRTSARGWWTSCWRETRITRRTGRRSGRRR